MSLVRAIVPDGDGDQLTNVSPELAEANGWEVLADEPTHGDDGRPLPPTRVNGRPVKPKTTVGKASTAKKAEKPAAADNPPSKEN